MLLEARLLVPLWKGLREGGVTRRGTRETSGVLVVKAGNNHSVQFVNVEFYKNLSCTLFYRYAVF